MYIRSCYYFQWVAGKKSQLIFRAVYGERSKYKCKFQIRHYYAYQVATALTSHKFSGLTVVDDRHPSLSVLLTLTSIPRDVTHRSLILRGKH